MRERIGSDPSIEGKQKPIFAVMVETYAQSADPEKAAFDALYGRLEPNLSDTEKLDKMKGLVDEYRSYKQTIN